MQIEISNGELLDKLTILEIKLKKIDEPDKLANVKGEYALLKPLANELVETVRKQYENLLQINTKLWEIEDTIRSYEQNQQFGNAFIQTARKVYMLNDERARIKKEINTLTNSGITEEKSYTGY